MKKFTIDGELHNDEEAVKVDNPAMMAMILANDTKIEDGGRLLGDPTETALIQYAILIKMSKLKIYLRKIAVFKKFLLIQREN